MTSPQKFNVDQINDALKAARAEGDQALTRQLSTGEGVRAAAVRWLDLDRSDRTQLGRMTDEELAGFGRQITEAIKDGRSFRVKLNRVDTSRQGEAGAASIKCTITIEWEA